MSGDDTDAGGDSLQERREERVRDYFRLGDAGDPARLDLFTEDAEVYFPKFGSARGKPALLDLAARLRADLEYLARDTDGLRFHPSGDTVVVEGREWGRTVDGLDWPDGEVSTGRFCNVFTFEGELISALSIYTDPDFTSADTKRVAALHGPRAT